MANGSDLPLACHSRTRQAADCLRGGDTRLSRSASRFVMSLKGVSQGQSWLNHVLAIERIAQQLLVRHLLTF